jgi:hypothetical protein
MALVPCVAAWNGFGKFALERESKSGYGSTRFLARMMGKGTVSIRLIWIVLGFVTATAAVAQAQDYSAGKTPAQLFASDCSGCHKSPQGLAKDGDARSLASFLREHYTSKKESAGALAAFVAGAGAGPAGAKSTGRTRTAVPTTEPKPAEEPRAARQPSDSPSLFPWSAVKPPEAKPEAETPADGAKPAARRRTATPSEPKTDPNKTEPSKSEPSTPAIIRHKGGSRPAIRPPVEAAKPAEAPKPAEASKPAEAKPAAGSNATAAAPAAVSEDKVKSYLESGAPAKALEAGDKRPDASAPLNSYATSGDTAGAKAASAGKPSSGKPADEPKPESAAPAQKPAAE